MSTGRCLQEREDGVRVLLGSTLVASPDGDSRDLEQIGPTADDLAGNGILQCTVVVGPLTSDEGHPDIVTNQLDGKGTGNERIRHDVGLDNGRFAILDALLPNTARTSSASFPPMMDLAANVSSGPIAE